MGDKVKREADEGPDKKVPQTPDFAGRTPWWIKHINARDK